MKMKKKVTLKQTKIQIIKKNRIIMKTDLFAFRILKSILNRQKRILTNKKQISTIKH